VARWCSPRDLLRTIVRESFPILVIAGALDTVAGVTVEGQVEALVTLPVFLVAIPPFLGLSGSLGGILASRIGTKLHLGLVDPRRRSLRPVADDVLLVVLYAIPVYALLGLSSHVVGSVVGLDSPGWLDMVEVVVLAGVLTLAVIVLVAFFSETFAHRMGLDPDNFGIPTVTSTLDLGGAFAFVLALTVLGHL
jgi:mgtE-like transporter